MQLSCFLCVCVVDGSVLWEITGAGFSSISKYMYGKVSVEIKLVEGDSAGTVTAFYVSSLHFINLHQKRILDLQFPLIEQHSHMHWTRSLESVTSGFSCDSCECDYPATLFRVQIPSICFLGKRAKY